jgi:hypothetical protein
MCRRGRAGGRQQVRGRAWLGGIGSIWRTRPAWVADRGEGLAVLAGGVEVIAFDVEAAEAVADVGEHAAAVGVRGLRCRNVLHDVLVDRLGQGAGQLQGKDLILDIGGGEAERFGVDVMEPGCGDPDGVGGCETSGSGAEGVGLHYWEHGGTLQY